ncbi:hypothetical protein [Paraburkholderia xenovorans]
MPYPEDYLETVEQARQERDSARERALEVMVSNMVDYGRGVPGLPRLGGDRAAGHPGLPLCARFFRKTLIPFVTDSGYGLGSCRSIPASHAPKARLLPGFVTEEDQERRTMNQVNDRLSGIRVNG